MNCIKKVTLNFQMCLMSLKNMIYTHNMQQLYIHAYKRNNNIENEGINIQPEDLLMKGNKSQSMI